MVVSGCRPNAVGTGPLAIPAANAVRLIVGASAPISADHAQWTWSVLGERNWTITTAHDTQLTLGGSYPLNDVKHYHGCNTWNCDLTVDRDRAHPDQAAWTLTLHGSNGKTAVTRGAMPLGGGDLSSAVASPLETGAVEKLPATFHLAKLGAQDVTVVVNP